MCAQARTLLLLPDDASPELRETLQVELQLSGRRVALGHGRIDLASARELYWLAEGEVLACASRGDAIEVVAVSGGRLARERLSAVAGPRAVALVALALLEATSAASPEPPVPEEDQAEPTTERAPPGDRGPADRSPSSALAPASALVAPALPSATVPSARVPAPPPVAERVGWEVLGALLAGGALAAGGALTADALAGNDRTFEWWAVGLAIGGSVGSTAGALLAGRLTGVDGDAGWSIAAGLAGGVVGGLLLVVGNVTDVRPDDGVTSGWTYLGATLAAVLPTALTVIAFELTVPTSRAPRRTLRVGPTGWVATF